MLSAKLGDSLPFTRQEIADMSGLTIETAIRIMSRLKKSGVIGSARGHILILDEVRLRLLSEATAEL
jgi:CRP-like cAMP-binding protein